MTKKQRLIRLVAGITTVGVAVLGLEMIDSTGTSLGATVSSVNLTCDGVSGDDAGALGDSKKTLAALGNALELPISIDVQAPTKVTSGSGPFTATFIYSITLPPDLISKTKDLLGLSSINVTSSTYAIDYSGAATGTLTTTVANTIVDLNSPTISQTLSGQITPTSDGQIIYKPGPSRLAMAINVTTPIKINTLQVVCTSLSAVGSTTVQIPGAPNVDPGIITVPGSGMSLTTVDLGPNITPNDGNPVIPESLKVTQGPGDGFGLLKGTTLYYVGPQAGGTRDAQLQVCGASRDTKAVPGVNSITTLDIPKYLGGDLNAHPVAFKLSLKHQAGGGEPSIIDTAPIQMSYYPNPDILGVIFGGQPAELPSDWDAENASLWDKGNARYVEPTPAAIQSALEALPSGKGAFKVTKRAVANASASASFDIELTGAFGNSPDYSVQMGAFSSWLPASIKAGLLALGSKPPPDPNAPPTTTAVPDTQATLDAKLMSGNIGVGEWLSGMFALSLSSLDVPALLDSISPLFPETPTTKASQAGVIPIPSVQTGLLCTAFTVQYKLTPGAVVLATTQAAGPPCPTKSVLKRVKVRVKGRTRTVLRRVVVQNCPVAPKVCPTKTVLKRVKVRANGRTRYVRRRVVVPNCPKVAVAKKKVTKRR